MTNGEIIEQLENTIGLIEQDGKDWFDDRDIPILEACIKSLTALDKIRAEIKDAAFDSQEIDGEHESIIILELNDALSIIDKYKSAESENKKYEAKIITRGKCMMCGKELTEGLFFCKECRDKANSRK